MNKLRWSAIWRAAISVATFALPIGILQKWLVESGRIDKGGAANLLLSLAILFTGMLGGYAAGKLEPDGGVQNGAAASFLAGLSIAVGGATLANGLAHLTTLRLSLDYLGPGRLGDWLQAEGEVFGHDEHVAQVRGRLYGPRHEVLTGLGAFALLGRQRTLRTPR